MRIVLLVIAIYATTLGSVKAHAIITFDHAMPAVGSTVDGASGITLYFTTNYDSDNIDIELHGQSGNRIPLEKIHTRNLPVVMAHIKQRLNPGVYAVVWEANDGGEDDKVSYTYHFTVR